MENQNLNNISEATNDNQNDKDIQIGEKEGEQVDKEKEQAAESQEKDAGKEREADREEGTDSQESLHRSNVSGEKGFSSHYAPPNYVPNFTVVGSPESTISSSSGTLGDEPRKKKSVSFGLLIGMCALTLALSVIIGSLAGALSGGKITLGLSGANKTDGIVNIIRNDKEITIDELPGNIGQANMSVSQVAALVGESVVEITTAHVQTSMGYGQYIQSGAGSGVVYGYDEANKTGYIITNYHVIEGADEIAVRIKNGESYYERMATYYAGDPMIDLAIITVTIEPESGHALKPATITNNSDTLIVGQQVVAIGNPLGELGGTVTDGIISALGREVIVENYPMVLLQTNAAINPGNSGGGLFNMAGELIGIVNAKQSAEGIEGLGFAIPANVVYASANDLIEKKYVTGRATLGITVQEGYWQGQGEKGVFVTDAGSSGLVRGDRITKIGDVDVSTLSDYYIAMRRIAAGDTVEIIISRTASGGIFGSTNTTTKTVTVTASEDRTVYGVDSQ